jgi:type I restriction enzyme S subunit
MSEVIKNVPVSKTTQNKAEPELRFAEFEQSWLKNSLSDISVDVCYGMNSSAIGFDGINKYLRITDIDEGSNTFLPNPLTSPDSEIENKYILKDGDIVFARTGASTGKTYLYKTKDGRLLFAGFLIKFSIVNADARFIFYQTLRSRYKKWVEVMSMRSGQPGINAEEYKSFSFNKPGITEQQKIADFLSSVDKKIEQLTEKHRLLTEYKKGVMQQIFTQQIRFKDNQGNDYPEWVTKKLDTLLEERRTQTQQSEEYPLMAFIAYKGVAEKGDRYNRDFLVSDKEGKKYKQTEYGDFIYSSNNLEVGSIGLNTYGKASISPVYSIFKIKEKCDYRFISNYLVRKSFINKMIRFRQGVVYGQWRIHESEFLKIEDSIPVFEEQQKIANFLTEIDQKIDQAWSTLEQTKVFKKGLLQQMFV